MRATLAVGLLSGLSLLMPCGCRSAGEGSAARDITLVSGDVARRTGTPPASPSDDASAAAACRGLLARPLTEESAVKVALLANRSVREAYERLGIARADLLQAGLISNPVFTASAKFFSRGPEIELGLAQSFVDLFFMPLRRRVASADLCAAGELGLRPAPLLQERLQDGDDRLRVATLPHRIPLPPVVRLEWLL